MSTAQEWIATLESDFAMCRDLAHNWQPHDAFFDKEHNAYRRILECGRCSTRRMQWVSLSGLLSTNTYTYPKGYQKPSGTGALDAEQKGRLRLRNMGV